MDIEDDYFFNNMKNSELICKQFNDFNDPYESHYGINANWPSPYKEEDKLIELIRQIEPIRFGEITASKHDMKDYIQSYSQLRDYTMDVISNSLMNFRICSFSRRWSHILMWAHYANSCRGLALIFDQDKILDCKNARLTDSNEPINGTNIPLRWITYKKVPPVLNSVELLKAVKIGTEAAIEFISKTMLDVCVLSKYSTWRYEQETRMITRLTGNVGGKPILYQYDPDALKGVIFGHKCDIEKIKIISKLLPEKSKVYLTKPAASRYKVEILETWRAAQIANGDVEFKLIVKDIS